jgi:hypothetical protein
MSRLLLFLSGIFFAGTIALALWTGFEAITSAHLGRCLLRVEEAVALGQISKFWLYARELGWLVLLAVSILFFQLGSHIDENNHEI